MTTGEKSVRDLIFEALCLRFHSTIKVSVSNTMTREELAEATGLTAEALVPAVRALVGPNADQDLFIRFVGGDPDKVTLGVAWVSRCEGAGAGA